MIRNTLLIAFIAGATFTALQPLNWATLPALGMLVLIGILGEKL